MFSDSCWSLLAEAGLEAQVWTGEPGVAVALLLAPAKTGGHRCWALQVEGRQSQLLLARGGRGTREAPALLSKLPADCNLSTPHGTPQSGRNVWADQLLWTCGLTAHTED